MLYSRSLFLFLSSVVGSSSSCGIVFVVLIVVAVLVILLIAKHETFELEELHHLAAR